MPTMRAVACCLLATLWVGCVRDKSAVLEPAEEVSSLTVSGRVLGPDGRNICRTIGDGTMLIRLLNPEFGISSDVAFLAEQDLTCPDNQYSIPADPGTAHLRVELPINDNLDALPWRNLDRFAASATHNLRVEQGTPLGGRARLDGQPFEGVIFNVSYEFNPGFGATFGNSGPNGRWMEFFGRSPAILENGQRYFASSTCDVTLGTRQLRGFPDGSFLFPTGRSALNCDLETAAAARFTHDFTRLAVTPFPGDIGGSFLSELSDQYGVGFGVQFPIQPGAPSQAVIDLSHMFTGGLIVGVGPDQILTGVPAVFVGMQCDPTCHDLGPNGTAEFDPPLPNGRQAVTWRYSDALSAEGVGLRVVQRSIDGSRGNDYVLFRFHFRNTSQSELRFFAGVAGDWDTEFDAGDDQGFTAMGRKLMFQVSAAETGIHIGTMLLGQVPVSGSHFFLPEEFLSEADQWRALRGALRRTTAGPTDLRYIHSAGPITLGPEETQDVWLAVVAGENRTQLLNNARAAEADVATRLTEPIAEQAATVFNPPRAIRGTGQTISRQGCKNCKPR